MPFADLLHVLESHSGPALTWYGTDRVEFGGPAAARWLAKAVNLLDSELSAGLFGEAQEPAGGDGGTGDRGAGSLVAEDLQIGDPNYLGVLRVDLGCSWQAALWTEAAWGSGWRVVGPYSGDGPYPDLGEATVWVVSHVDANARHAAAEGLWVLAHDLSPFAVAWGGDPLPDGVMDALGELMAQPDNLPDDPMAPWGSPIRSTEPPRSLTDRVLVGVDDGIVAARTALSQWSSGHAVVAVDRSVYPEDAQVRRIAEVEHARWLSYLM